ncbi:MAG: DNA cytosine methyltransferase [Chloroflexia bacterium]
MKINSTIDLFCGVGGITHGFRLEGLNVVAGVDSDVSCEYPYTNNNPGTTFLHKKVEELDPVELLQLYPADAIKILVGCAPCQEYSKYAKRYAKAINVAALEGDDTSVVPDSLQEELGTEADNAQDKWDLLGAFADLIDAVDPDIVSMENVPELEEYKDGSIFETFVDRLTPRYNVTWYTVYCPDYGIPQSRTRLVLFASTLGKVNLVKKTHTSETYRTVRDAIGDLPPLQAGEVCCQDPLHRAAGLSDLNLRRIRHSLPGGTWRDWPLELRANCHTKDSGKSYASVYGRITWDDPAPTITTQSYGYGSGRFGHADQDRALSLREAALLQTFPEGYVFKAPEEAWSFKTIGRRIGNAVPVDLGRVVARSIVHHLEEYDA